MIYMASHDLRSPLINVQGFSRKLSIQFEKIRDRIEKGESLEAIRSELEPVLKDRIPASFRFIEAGSARMDSLIEGLLKLSRAGRPAGPLVPVDVDMLLRELRESMETQISGAEAEFRIETPLAGCVGEKVRLGQVFANLFDNALKYRDPSRPLEILVSSRVEARRVIYVIADTGVGIPPENLGKIWELFRRLETVGSVAGEGLGLTLARRIVEGFDGNIRAESEPGIGSRFIVELPAAR